MNNAQIIALILQVLAGATPQLIIDIVNLIHGNPQQQGEADDAYIARLSTQIDANAAKVAQQDADIQKDT